MHYHDTTIRSFEKNLKSEWKSLGRPEVAAQLISNAKMETEYLMGKCNEDNYLRWNHHYFDILKAKVT